MRQKKKTSIYPFVGIFGFLIAWMIFTNLTKSDITMLAVQDNKGVSYLETAGDNLVCVFQDGQTCVWDWQQLPQQKKELNLRTDHVVLLTDQELAAVNLTGPKILSVIDFKTGQKREELKVGRQEQNCWLRISCDKSVISIIRQNPADVSENTLYEFMAVNLPEQLVGLPASLFIKANEQLVDFSVDARQIMYAVGSGSEQGRIAVLDLDKGKSVWDRVYEKTKEFCSVIISLDDQYILAGNRDGILYKLDAQSGDIIKKIQILDEGEARPITNDYSVLNLAFSPDGRYYVATINPVAYILDAESDTVIHKFSPANKLVSKIAFSPENKFIATSDIRAGWPIKIWPMPHEQ